MMFDNPKINLPLHTVSSWQEIGVVTEFQDVLPTHPPPYNQNWNSSNKQKTNSSQQTLEAFSARDFLYSGQLYCSIN